jgi:asparagine N-glycosylation enzyme membrane subunit Stt3
VFATGTLYTGAWTQQSTDLTRSALLGATLIGVLGLTNPFTLVPLCTVVALHAVLMIVMNPEAPRRCGLVSGATMIASAAPFVGYSALSFTLNPFWGATYGSQNVTLTPPPLDLLLGLGMTVPLAALAAPGFARERTPARLFVLAWIVTAALLMYAPFGIQRRFAFGLQPMLAIVAAFALREWWLTIRGPLPLVGTTARPFLTLILGQLVIGTSVAGYMLMIEVATNPAEALREPTHPNSDRSVFQPVALSNAADWLASRMTPNDIVLSHALTGNHLAGRIPGRVYVGHWVASLNFEEKRRQSRWFYAAPLDEARMHFLHEAGIRYVVYGPHERAPLPPDDAHLAPVYDVDSVVVFVVESE